MSDWQGQPRQDNRYDQGAQQGYFPQNPQAFRAPRGATNPNDLTLPLYGASLAQAAKRFFKSYARFTGRASRSEYWWAQLFIFLLSLIPGAIWCVLVVIAALNSSNEFGDGAPLWVNILGVVGGLLTLLLIFGLIIPQLAIEARRLHDAGFSGFFLFFRVVPGGSLVLFVLSLFPSTSAGERYDPGTHRGW